MAQGRLRRLVTRRRVQQALVCLILGSAMTIAVAWGCELFAPRGWSRVQQVSGPYFERYRPDDWPQLDTLWLTEIVGITYRVAEAIVSIRLSSTPGEDGVSKDVYYWISENQYGLPWRSMSFYSSEVWGDPQARADPNFPVPQQPIFPLLARGIDVPTWSRKWFGWPRLPLRPMWPGFLSSTLVYGSFASLVLSVVSFLQKCHRLSRRKRRGLCVKCGYPVDDFAVCPECGTPTGRDA